MDQYSKETARRVKENDPTLTDLCISLSRDIPRRLTSVRGANQSGDGVFTSNNSSDLSKLGEGIGMNTSLLYVVIDGNALSNATTATRSYHTFFEGFKRNCSICSLTLVRFNLSRGAGNEMLRSFEENCEYLRTIFIAGCELGNEGTRALASTLAACSGAKQVYITHSVDDEVLGELISASFACHQGIQGLDLMANNIGRAGCDALSTLLKDPNSNIQTLLMAENNIDDGCVAVLANALSSSNCKLKYLGIDENPQITGICSGLLSRVLCNTSSINDTYLSNHTLAGINCSSVVLTDGLRQLLELNNGVSKRLVAMKKILQYHTHLDMEPFFKWNLKVLPLAVDWFDSAIGRFREGEGMNADEIMGVSARKLSSIYQFVRAMPMTCVTSANEKGAKRKLDAVE